MHIALVTNQAYPNLLGGEVLPLEAFSKAGYEASPAVWNDPSVEWRHFGHIILRGCWGYHRQIEEFYTWLDKLAALGVTVQNPPEIVRWNSHKRYLLDLQSHVLCNELSSGEMVHTRPAWTQRQNEDGKTPE